jgi:hypothetical protein
MNDSSTMSGLEFIPLVLPFAQFLRDVLSKRRSEEEQRAGEVLYSSGMLIVLLLELYNMLRTVTDDLSHVHAQEPKEKEQVIRNFRQFIMVEKVMPYVEGYVKELAVYKERNDKFYAESVRIIWEAGKHIVDLKGYFSDREYELFTREGGFDAFIDLVRNAKTDREIDHIRQRMNELVQNFDKESIDKARNEYSEHLKIMIKDKYPALPRPPL